MQALGRKRSVSNAMGRSAKLECAEFIISSAHITMGKHANSTSWQRTLANWIRFWLTADVYYEERVRVVINDRRQQRVLINWSAELCRSAAGSCTLRWR